MSHRPLPDTPGAPGTMSNRWQSLESVNSIESCDPHSFIALYDFKGDDDDQLSIKANQEVGVRTYIFRVPVECRESGLKVMNPQSLLFQNHPQRYEKLICFHSYTATTIEKF